MTENQNLEEQNLNPVSDSETTQTEAEKTYAFPISILEKEDNPQMDVNLKMDVNFYAQMYLLAEKLNNLKNLLSDKNMSLNQKFTILGDAFKDSEVETFTTATSTLIYAIAHDQAEKGFIKRMSQKENMDKMKLIMDEAIKQAEEKNPKIKRQETVNE